MACSGCTGFSVKLPQLAAGSFSSAPIHGVVASLLTVRRGPQPKDSNEKSAPAKAASTAFKCNKALTKNSNGGFVVSRLATKTRSGESIQLVPFILYTYVS